MATSPDRGFGSEVYRPPASGRTADRERVVRCARVEDAHDSAAKSDAPVAFGSCSLGGMMNATRSGRADETSGRYDFDRLERSIDFLIDEHQRLSAEKEALLGELRERELRIAMLEARLESERSQRATAVELVDKVLSRLQQLQASVFPGTERV